MAERPPLIQRLLARRRARRPGADDLTPMETAPVEMTEAETRAVAPRRGDQIPLVVFYDGDCGLCSRTVRWVVNRDPARAFHFAPLTGETAAEVAARHPELPPELDSLLLLDRRHGRETVHWYADAAVRIAAELEAPARWLAWLAVLPRWLTDAGYRLIGRLRHHLFPRGRAAHQGLGFAEYSRFLP